MRYLSIFLLSSSMWAQFAPHTVVRGELQIDGADTGSDYQVELAECSGDSQGVRGWMSGGTRFEFDRVTPGCKILRVVTGPQRTIVQEVQIFAEESSVPLVIRVANPRKEPVSAEVVSVDRLRHPIPQDVAHAMRDANRLWQAGQYAGAGEKLRPIAAKYPDVWELRLDLGIVEMKLQNVGAAAQHFLRVRELEPRSPVAALDAGFALLQLRRLDEAESAAKDAVALEPGNRVAQSLLAHIQAAKHESAKP